MSNQQKSAWYTLTVALLAIAAYVVLWRIGGAAVAPAAMAVLALIALAPRFFANAVSDERERQIARRAGLAGGIAAYLFVVVTCMVVWWTHFRAAPPVVDVNLLPLLVMGAAVALLLGQAVAVLLLVRRPLAAGD